jgi:hypothetical protein
MFSGTVQAKASDYITLVVKSLLNVSATVLFLFKAQTAISAMDGIQQQFAKFHQVGCLCIIQLFRVQ